MGDERKVQLLEASLAGTRTYRRLAAVATTAAAVFAAIAGGAYYYANETRLSASDATQRTFDETRQSLNNALNDAQRTLDDATAMISALAAMTAQTARSNPRADNIEAVRDLTRKAISRYGNPATDAAAEQRARTYLALAEIDSELGWLDRTEEDALAALTDLDRLANGGNTEALHLRGQTERLIGATHWQRGNNEEAKLHYERGISHLDELLRRNTDAADAWRWIRSLANLHEALGDVLLYRFDRRDEALVAYDKSRELREQLVALGHQGPALEIDLARVAGKRAEVAERKGNIEEALALSSEALERMENLKDRIWDNLNWAADYGTVGAIIARLKRKQKRYAEAAPAFGRAEEILLTVTKRDPKNKTRAATLNWIRFLRAENFFRLGMQNNDRVRLLAVREQAQAIIATTTALAADPAQSVQMRANKVREEALLAAIDATLRQLNGNFDSAAAGYLEASDIIANGYLADGKRPPWADLMTEDIEYLEWAGAAYVKAQKPTEAQLQLKRAADMLEKYRALLGDRLYEDLHLRIDARIDHSPPAVGTVPATAARTPPPTAVEPNTSSAESGTPQPSAPPTADPAPSAGDPVNPPQQ